MLDLKTVNFDRGGPLTIKIDQKFQAEKVAL
jgi:hypothetical protein